MPLWYSSSKPATCTFHDLTSSNNLKSGAASILGLGRNFIPTPRRTTNLELIKEATLDLHRQISWKYFYAGDESDLLKTSLYVKSDNNPPLPGYEIDRRLDEFSRSLERNFRKTGSSKANLLPYQKTLLEELQSNQEIIIAQSDKGLGPCAVDLERYIKDGIRHISDESSYEIISEEQGAKDIDDLELEIQNWLLENEGNVLKMHANYIRQQLKKTRENPYGYAYQLYKLHKKTIDTRLVVSDCGSLIHSLGKWVNEMLQPIMLQQRTYFKNTFELKSLLLELGPIPSNASLFTYDAIKMYPSIETEECLERLAAYLRRPETQVKFDHYHPDALIEALGLVMRNNRFKFGDVLVKQIKGIAMGMSPAPPISNLYVAIHEEEEVLQYVACNWLLFLKRFIDDGIGIWLHHSNPAEDERRWKEFQAVVARGGLAWDFSKRSNSMDFMDVTISLVDNRVEFKLFEKPLALHLYLPPHSSHPPGVIKGLVMGEVLRIFQLCSHDEDIDHFLSQFFGRLLNRGYQAESLRPLFIKAVENAENYLLLSEAQRRRIKAAKAEANKRRVYLKIPYHPSDLPRKKIQHLWYNLVANPDGKTPFNQLNTCNLSPTGPGLAAMPIDQLIVAYRRAPNLGNLLSYRKIDDRGLKVSSFMVRPE